MKGGLESGEKTTSMNVNDNKLTANVLTWFFASIAFTIFNYNFS